MYVVIFALPLLQFKLGFLNLNTIDLWGWKIPLRGAVLCTVGCAAAFLALLSLPKL